MKVLLRHARTGYYYRNHLEWVMTPADAMGFRGTEEALEVAGKERLDGMTIVLRHDDTGREQVLSLNHTEATIQQRAGNPQSASSHPHHRNGPEGTTRLTWDTANVEYGQKPEHVEE
jgi:hypothetical protein